MAEAKNTKKGRGDAKETIIAYLVPEITTFLVNTLVPAKFFEKNVKAKMAFLKFALPGTGYLIRKITKLPPFLDDLVTDFFQETSQSFDIRREVEEAKRQKTQDTKDAQALYIELVVKLITASKDPVELASSLINFDELLKSFSESDQIVLLRALSKAKYRQLINFFLMDVEDQKKVFAGAFSEKDVAQKPEEQTVVANKTTLADILADGRPIANKLKEWKEKSRILKLKRRRNQ